MKRKIISAAALLAMLPVSTAFASALDRSGQPMNVFLQDGSVAEVGYTWLSPEVKGKETSGTAISNMGKDYSFPSAAVKYQVNDQVSVGLLYDQPFGANIGYGGTNSFTTTADEMSTAALNVLKPSVTARLASQGLTAAQIQAVLPTALKQAANTTASKAAVAKYTLSPSSSLGTNVTVHSQNLTLLGGYKPNKNWSFYGGPVYQTIKGDVHLRGSAYSVYNGYDAVFDSAGGWGYAVGAAYHVPDIALRAAVTYRSAITHNLNTSENFVNYKTYGGSTGTSSTTKIKTPQSVNFDFQTGVAPNTVAFANLRWVNWKGFKIQPGQFTAVSKDLGPAVGKPNGFSLLEYGKDQYTATVGVGRKFNENWAGNVSVGWDSGTGSYASTLGPVKGSWNVGAGVQYSPTKNTYVSLGAKYFWLGDAKSQVGSLFGTTNYNAEFSGNHAVAVGVKMGYRW